MAVFNTIATAAKTAIDALSLGISTVIRKDGVLLTRDTPPLIVISLAADNGEQWATTGNGTTDQGTVGREYVLGIEVYRANQADIAADSDNPDIFQTVKRALNKGSLASATTVWDTRLVENEMWEPGPFAKGGEVSGFALVFGSAEVRNV